MPFEGSLINESNQFFFAICGMAAGSHPATFVVDTVKE